MHALQNSLLALIRGASSELPDDVQRAIRAGIQREDKGTIAASVLEIVERNAAIASEKCRPLCQDTGSLLFYVDAARGFDRAMFTEAACEAVRRATRDGLLRQNSVDAITGENDGTNVGPGAPTFHFNQHRVETVEVRLILKGGGCENVGAQYSLPDHLIGADRDIAGCRRAVLDAVFQAQGRGCAPGVLGVCIGGDRATGYELSKRQFLRRLDDTNPNAVLDGFERDVLMTANKLGIGPMGFGGRTTLLGVKVCAANRVPASFFVTVSYMCWAFRRQGVVLDPDGEVQRWIY